jgi:hypothetical protein
VRRFIRRYKTYKSAWLILRAWVNVREDLERSAMLENVQALDHYDTELSHIEKEMERFVLLNS